MNRFPSAVPLLHDYLERSNRLHPDKTALVTADGRLTYGQLEADANAVAVWLAKKGVGRGDRVLVFGPNTAETTAAFWGVLKANAVVSLINPQTKLGKLSYLLKDCTPGALIAEGRLSRTFLGAIEESGQRLPVLTWGKAARGMTPADPGTVTEWARAMRDGDGQSPPDRLALDIDLASIIYTSGSTGDPKGVMLTHRNMLTAATSVSTYLEMREDDVVLNILPLSFDYGMYQLIMAARLGATLVLEQCFAYPARILEVMEKEGITGFPGVPTVFAMMAEMDNLSRYNLSRVRYISNTAATLTQANIHFLKGAFPTARVYSMYGITECHRISYLPPEELDSKPRSVGIPIPDTEFWVVDEQGEPIGPNQVGELVVRGATVMAGYWGDEGRTAKKLRPGWIPGERVLFTGDLARVNEEGYLFFVGRTDDIIKCRGEKVAPKEVEDAICRVPGVREAAVLGEPHEILGQAVKAFVVAEPGAHLTEREVLRACRETLEAFMVPESVTFLPELPKTGHGKIWRSRIQTETLETAES